MSDIKGMGGLKAMRHDKKNPPSEPTTSFEGKTVLVTGANAGVGFQTALKVAKLGVSKLILGVRNLNKGEAAKALMLSQSSISPGDLVVESVDCDSPSSVSSFAKRISSSVDGLDVVLLNAGIAAPSYSVSKSGWEMTLHINVLSTAQLALELLPLLRRSAEAHGRPSMLAITGSEGYLDAQEPWLTPSPDEGLLEHVNKQDNFDVGHQYHIAKILVQFFQQGLVETLARNDSENEPIALVVSPGMCRTDMGREFGWAYRAFMELTYAYVGRTAEEGSRAMVSGLSQGKEANGKFWKNNGFLEYVPQFSQWDKDTDNLSKGGSRYFRKRVGKDCSRKLGRKFWRY
ncbi:MAG: hypothetical protein M1820_002698 [Bogoriella megaspora]|nr:MAG: hypothetical protein M1820_002698 [Bogoriella megaspora]